MYAGINNDMVWIEMNESKKRNLQRMGKFSQVTVQILYSDVYLLNNKNQ